MDKPLYVEFSVTIRNEKYTYGKNIQSGESMIKFSAPRAVVEHLDLGSIFQASLAAALARFDLPESEDEK